MVNQNNVPGPRPFDLAQSRLAGTKADAFFEHFSLEDKPTKLGMWLGQVLSRKIFKYTQVASGSSILEIGPGRGSFVDICREYGMEYTAIEPNSQMAVELSQRGANVICAIVPPLPRLDKKFDLVVMINVMEHMSSMQDALQVTKQIRGVLKPKAKLVIHSPDYLSWRLNFFNCDFTHNYVTTRRRLSQLLVNAGFVNIKSRYFSGPLTGFGCFWVSVFSSWLPFAFFNALFPNNKVFHKLYKLQLTFLRNVLILGENHDQPK